MICIQERCVGGGCWIQKNQRDESTKSSLTPKCQSLDLGGDICSQPGCPKWRVAMPAAGTVKVKPNQSNIVSSSTFLHPSLLTSQLPSPCMYLILETHRLVLASETLLETWQATIRHECYQLWLPQGPQCFSFVLMLSHVIPYGVTVIVVIDRALYMSIETSIQRYSKTTQVSPAGWESPSSKARVALTEV